MSTLNSTPAGERLRIALFGKRNAGKSSLLNALTGVDVAVVSEVAGTTTDPVVKHMEFLPLGPVTFVDTPGYDDTGRLGEKRIEKSLAEAKKCDVAIFVFASDQGFDEEDAAFCRMLTKIEVPFFIVANKSELPAKENSAHPVQSVISASAATHQGLEAIKEALSTLEKGIKNHKTLLQGLFRPGDMLLLVTPIDESAPKGRLILPQQMTIRDILDGQAMASIMQPDSVPLYLKKHRPDLVITDSQVFKEVADMLPPDLPLTSFSIIMARYKGDLPALVDGTYVLKQLKPNDRILISEGCTHRRQCNDIGTVKLPNLLRRNISPDLQFDFTSGTDFPKDAKDYALVIHCGGCMLNPREMQARINHAKEHHVPITNYGLVIAYFNGILDRALEPFQLSRR